MGLRLILKNYHTGFRSTSPGDSSRCCSLSVPVITCPSWGVRLEVALDGCLHPEARSAEASDQQGLRALHAIDV